ncbi:hypothetical protein DFP72DRAFT_851383 [Ephemerocybe angulata]|uniref:Uncharacterized protein n=1 Tax=Ephemerocybe angulata TaxID=980116 RepID=A0A8H6M2J1_9AGAR|nr:hypothetical protein DFP72DRAFT_851383 [Tulosesus angulatus]
MSNNLGERRVVVSISCETCCCSMKEELKSMKVLGRWRDMRPGGEQRHRDGRDQDALTLGTNFAFRRTVVVDWWWLGAFLTLTLEAMKTTAELQPQIPTASESGVNPIPVPAIRNTTVPYTVFVKTDSHGGSVLGGDSRPTVSLEMKKEMKKEPKLLTCARDAGNYSDLLLNSPRRRSQQCPSKVKFEEKSNATSECDNGQAHDMGKFGAGTR